jgi:hypothetical protein
MASRLAPQARRAPHTRGRIEATLMGASMIHPTVRAQQTSRRLTSPLTRRILHSILASNTSKGTTARTRCIRIRGIRTDMVSINSRSSIRRSISSSSSSKVVIMINSNMVAITLGKASTANPLPRSLLIHSTHKIFSRIVDLSKFAHAGKSVFHQHSGASSTHALSSYMPIHCSHLCTEARRMLLKLWSSRHPITHILSSDSG